MRPRLVLWNVVFFVVGMWAARWWPQGWTPVWLGGPALLCAWVVWRRQAMVWMLVLAAVVGCFFSVGDRWRDVPGLEEYVGQEVGVRGRVAEEPVHKQNAWRFPLEIQAVQIQGRWQEVEERAILKLEASEVIHYGDLLQTTHVPLDKPSPARNPGAFDAETYYATKGIHYSLSLPGKSWRVIGHDDRGWQGRVFLPIRHHLLNVIDEQFALEHRAVVAGLLLGITDEIDPSVMDSFRTMGVVHILAVSGANIALLVFPLLSLLKWCRLSERKRFAVVIVFVILYGGITGGGPSVVRACTMTILYCIGRMAHREVDSLTSIAVAAWLTLVYDPAMLDDLGFQLTFLITLGLLLIPERLEELLRKFRRVVRSSGIRHRQQLTDETYQTDRTDNPRFIGFLSWMSTPILLTLTAELISVPLLLTINPAFSPVSLLANLYLIPLLALLVPFAALTVLLGLIHQTVAYLPAFGSRLLLDGLLHPMLYLGEARWWLRNYRASAEWWLWGYYGWWLLFVWKKRNRWKSWGIATLGVCLVGALVAGAMWPKDLRVTYLDVGQGDSALIEMPRGQVWLVDGGGIPGFTHSDFDIGEKVVVPALAASGVNTIDVLVMTHADEDHVRGLAAVVERFKVLRVVVSDMKGKDKPFYRNLLQTVKDKGIPLTMAAAGQTWEPETGVQIAFLNPPRRPYTGTRSDSNANSVVFSMNYGQRSFLFTADLEGDIESHVHLPARIDVLKVAHHGSGHSSTLPFLQKIHPEVAVISVGSQNRYGHPAGDTLKRLQTVGAKVWRTDEKGAVVCETDGETLNVSSWLP
ncbi:MAG: DNA internalization-related competence protein ComEC/Rec2 [Tumebacillaceae bacterium]